MFETGSVGLVETQLFFTPYFCICADGRGIVLTNQIILICYPYSVETPLGFRWEKYNVFNVHFARNGLFGYETVIKY